eukprot:gb/GECG01003656.1/.p1 GENE.gb/GECG01003656.1/~~gb/GECG01003656.1/.p1  ORF type:complete len:671 (+),score=66.58 gb/GECG01003656.1/:1-2013(+)
MKLFAAIVAVAATLAYVDAACPNSCSGHGQCGKDDLCTCWSGFSGYDCSSRDCPVVEAWILDDENPHAYAECANRGICNRATGTCTCFDGYIGRACQRSNCPNQCSGRGKCRLMADLPNYSPSFALDWDAKALTGCVCDPGFMGPDCSQRICVHGDDPMTACDSADKYQTQTTEIAVPWHDTGLREQLLSYTLTVFWIPAADGTNADLVISFDITAPDASGNYVAHAETLTVNLFTDTTTAIETAINAFIGNFGGATPPTNAVCADLSPEDLGTAPNGEAAFQCTFSIDKAGLAAGDSGSNTIFFPKVFEFTATTQGSDIKQVSIGRTLSGMWNFVDGDYSLVFDTFANETLYTRTVEEIFDNAGQAKADLLEKRLQELPLSRARGMSVTGTETEANMDGNQAEINYEHTFGGTAVGTQRSLQCAYKHSVNGISTFGCPYEGCQPKIQQSRIVQRDAVCSDRLHGLFTSDNIFEVLSEGVLGCPTGMDCSTQADDEFQAGADVVFYKAKDDDTDDIFNIYGRGLATPAFVNRGTLGPYAEIDDVVADSELIFLGQIRAASIRDETIDLGRVVPTMKIKIADNADVDTLTQCNRDFETTEGDIDQTERLPITFRVRYNVASCSDGAESDAVDPNVEFIECSGRGQCDRGSGLCTCFEGYHGAACDSQNVLV